MANNGLDLWINFSIVRELNCDGSIKPVADGGFSTVLPGFDDTRLDAGLQTEAIAAITSQCLSRPASERVSGSDALYNPGCGFNYPDLNAAFIYGRHESSGLGGVPQVSFDKPGEDDCKACAKSGSDTCPREFMFLSNYCQVNCKNDPIGSKFAVLRRVTQASLGTRKAIGGNNPDTFNSDISFTIGTNDGFGYGPADLLISDHEGEPECSAFTCDIECPPDLDLSALADLCGCDNPVIGCNLTPELLTEYPEYNIPILTA